MLIMLVPAFGPLALARVAPMESMHCMRRPLATARAGEPAMRCHEGLAKNGVAGDGRAGILEPEASFRSLDCCSNHDCCRSVKTSEWARPTSNLLSFLSLLVEPALSIQVASHILAGISGTDSARAPPVS